METVTVKMVRDAHNAMLKHGLVCNPPTGHIPGPVLVELVKLPHVQHAWVLKKLFEKNRMWPPYKQIVETLNASPVPCDRQAIVEKLAGAGKGHTTDE